MTLLTAGAISHEVAGEDIVVLPAGRGPGVPAGRPRGSGVELLACRRRAQGRRRISYRSHCVWRKDRVGTGCSVSKQASSLGPFGISFHFRPAAWRRKRLCATPLKTSR